MNDVWLRDDLTPKQLEYVSYLASGKSTMAISREYYVSHHTVRNTIAKAKKRVGANSTYNLIAMAITRKWIIPDDITETPIRYLPNE